MSPYKELHHLAQARRIVGRELDRTSALSREFQSLLLAVGSTRALLDRLIGEREELILEHQEPPAPPASVWQQLLARAAGMNPPGSRRK